MRYGPEVRVEIDLPDYSRESGLRIDWDPGFEIRVRVEDYGVVLSANPAGLRSLARILLSLTNEEIPRPYDLHLDSSNSLEPGSTPLIIELPAEGMDAAS
jgi:hypothetical protein